MTYVGIRNGLNLENQITNKSVDPYKKLCNKLSLETLGAYKIVIFRSIRIKLGSLNRKLYVDLKIGLKLDPIKNAVSSGPLFPVFFRNPVYVNKDPFQGMFLVYFLWIYLSLDF